MTDAAPAASQRSLVATERPLVVLVPGANGPRRRWSPMNFTTLGDALAERDGSIVIAGSAADRSLGASILARMRHPARHAA